MSVPGAPGSRSFPASAGPSAAPGSGAGRSRRARPRSRHPRAAAGAPVRSWSPARSARRSRTPRARVHERARGPVASRRGWRPGIRSRGRSTSRGTPATPPARAPFPDTARTRSPRDAWAPWSAERHLGGGSAALAEIDAIAQRTPDVEVDLRAVGVRREGAEEVARPRGLDGSRAPRPRGPPGPRDPWSGRSGGRRRRHRPARGTTRPDPSPPGSGGARSGRRAEDPLALGRLPNCAYASLAR